MEKPELCCRVSGETEQRTGSRIPRRDVEYTKKLGKQRMKGIRT